MKHISFNSFFFLSLLLTACSVKHDLQEIKFEGSFSEKKWAVKDLGQGIPEDWTPYGYLTFDFISSTTQRFQIALYDASGIRKLEIVPFQGAWIRASIPLVHFTKMNTEGMDMASIWKTPRPGYWIGFTGSVGSINHVDSLGISMDRPIGSPTLAIRNFRLTMNAEDSVLVTKPLVDEFGQWMPSDWPGKAKTLDDLKNSWDAEESLLADSTADSKYGGFVDTRARATGFFRVEKINGKWWFVDPQGHLFYSNGSNCVGPWSDLSRVQERAYIFSGLPPATELTLSDMSAGGGSEASFYTWNLYRRYGKDWYVKWMDMTFRRMGAWGINTIGNWSDPHLGKSQRKSYVATLEGWGIEEGPMGMPDVYDPGYLAKVDAAARNQCAPSREDPYLIGYFIGNEPPWPDREAELVSLILSGNQTPMQTELKKYLAGGDTPERRKEFVYETFSKFVNIVCSSIKKYDPNHLNLGFRFGNPPPTPVIEASKKYFEVFSLNHYGYTVELPEIQNIYDLTGLPVIIGEFHFGTPARGMAPGLAQTKNQEERGVAYRYYVENAAAHPAVIGTHWFQWIDQPVTGRFDGENYNIGLIDVTDRPYPELVNAVMETYGRLKDIHSGKLPPVTREALVQ